MYNAIPVNIILCARIMPVLNRCYQLVSGQYTSSSGTFTACSQRLALQSHTLWHILQKYFLLTMISLIIISIFDWWSGQPHTCLNTLPTLDGLTVILIFHYWLWKCIESPWLHVTLVLVPRNILNNLFFFSFEPMLIRLKIVGDVKGGIFDNMYHLWHRFSEQTDLANVHSPQI